VVPTSRSAADAGVPDGRERARGGKRQAERDGKRARAPSPTCIYWGSGTSRSVSGGEEGDLVPRCGTWGESPPVPPQCLPSAASRALAWSETHRQGCMGSRSQERKSWGRRWATFWGQERASTVADWLAAWWRQRSWTPRTADARSPVSGELSEARSRKPKLDGRFWLGHLGGPDWEPGRGRSAECGERVPSRRLHGRFENVRGKYQGELEG
jgi:hypothetical protein